MKLTFQYFDLAARGETARILLHASKADWTDERFGFPEWPEIKPTTPVGQVPTLTIDGTAVFCQSAAILRYVANMVGLYPKNDDPIKALIVDETLEGVSECMGKYPHTGSSEDKKNFQNDVMTKYFGLVESRIQQFGGKSKDTVCGVASVADLDLMAWVHFIQTGFYDQIEVDFFQDYPGITACVAKASERADVKAYYASLEK